MLELRHLDLVMYCHCGECQQGDQGPTQATLTAVCQGLCRISEQHLYTLESLPGFDVAATRSSLQNRLDSFSLSVTTSFGDVTARNELAPTCPSPVDLASSWAAGIMRERWL